MTKHLPIFALVFVAGVAGTFAGGRQAADAEAILQAFVDDFRNDSFAAKPITFGVRVKDAGDWHVVVGGRQASDGPVDVALRDGFPSEPAVFYVTDFATLEKIHKGEMSSLTAMGKARSSDFAPLDLDMMEGFQPGGDFLGHVIPLSFHFWTRGTPEIVRFGEKSMTREVHGGNAALLYYQPGFRSGWFQIERGQHVNADPADQVNPFPSMLVITAGRGTAKIGGEEITVQKGDALFIPPGVAHEFWNDNRTPVEGILMMFGEGA